MPSKIVEECVDRLVNSGLQIVFAESVTAGRIASEFSLVMESGSILLGSVVSYDPRVKSQILKVPQQLLEKHTPESAEVTRAMANGLRDLIESDIYVAVTGLASPGGSETPEKPIGTAFIHIVMPDQEVAHREVFDGEPEEVVLKIIDKTSQLITQHIPTLKNL
ncbi:MAG: CinA family protein [Flavobacterium sp.]|nr:CinA family protein [Flavobacterium sp.]